MPRRRLSLAVLGAFAAATMTLAPSMASAQYYGGGPYAGSGRGGAWREHGGGYARGGFDGYDDRGDPRAGGRDGPRDRRGYPRDYDRRRCRDGSTGTILGAIAGGLLGNSVAGRGDRTTGAIVGGGIGALAGRAIGRDC